MENYYRLFEKQLEDIRKKIEKGGKKPSLLLQACCCPCSSHCLEVLEGYFDISVYFYNPNIDERQEYDKRLDELKRFTKEADFALNVKVIEGDYEPELFYEMAKGRENLPERGERCYDCYKLRLRKTAEYAKAHGFDYFSTTLSISPYKNAEWLNEIGIELEKELREEAVKNGCLDGDETPVFLYSDFKKKNGYKRSIELSEEYGLYRQDYCGCVFSKRDRDVKKSQSEKN
ncbi:MAG: epoxyqueuosine reductase QueH [Eubacterium sp.]|nr:epoxyqueuosine reductase QueH [Eubacterium sp.]